MEGPDLLQLINLCGGCLPEPLAAFYFRQLLDALGAMHARGVVRAPGAHPAALPLQSHCQDVVGAERPGWRAVPLRGRCMCF